MTRSRAEAATDSAIARAQSLGRLAARDGQPVSGCPYGNDQRVLRARWVMAHAAVAAELNPNLRG